MPSEVFPGIDQGQRRQKIRLGDPRSSVIQRRVLIVENESSIRNLFYTLLNTLGCHGDVACSGQQALAMISRQPFDAVLLDLRCLDPAPEQVLPGILEIRPNLMGRVLVITGDVTDQNTMDLIDHNVFCVFLDTTWFTTCGISSGCCGVPRSAFPASVQRASTIQGLACG